MNLALPYLESLFYVERYNWFAVSDGIDSNSFYEPNGTTLTTLGNAYKNQVSTPSVTGNTVDAINNLNVSSFLKCN